MNALLNDPQFAWLRPISQLIVRIDELLGEKTPPMRNDVDAVVSQVKALTSPNAEGNIYERRYDTVLQEHPDAVFAHRDVLTLLKEDLSKEKRINEKGIAPPLDTSGTSIAPSVCVPDDPAEVPNSTTHQGSRVSLALDRARVRLDRWHDSAAEIIQTLFAGWPLLQ